jgi:cbb3-type cytochrome oxidase subunit 3
MGMAIFLLLLVAAFTAIVIWVFGRKRKARFAKYSRIPLDEENLEPPALRQD